MEQEAKRMGESSPTGQTKSISQKEEMQMFNRKFKLIGTAIGLVAVLVMGLAMPGATQQNPLARQNIVQIVSNAVGATLTASADDPLDMQRTLLWSSGKKTMAYVPLMPVARSWDLAEELVAGKDVGPVNFGVVYIVEHPKLPAGAYQLKLLSRGEAGLFNQSGELIATSRVSLKAAPGRPPFEIRVTIEDNVAHNSELIEIHLKSCTKIIILID